MGWPVSMTVGIVFIKLIDVGRSKPQWAAAFPRQRVLNYIKVERSS